MIYKVESAAPTLGAREIKISKIVPSIDNQIPTQDGEAENLKDSFAHLATVEYHKIRSSRIRMGDLDIATDDYFSKEGWSIKNFGRLVVFFYFGDVMSLKPLTFRNRIFTAPDGKEYFWSLGRRNCKARTSETC